ncbi:MAG TPA: hypothetical protein VEI02_14585 [Planctomycetota bacterium]|nr:hypothetical protein [Planctomycetota bacterium]
MPPSTDVPLTHALARLRDLSALTLDAVEREDYEALAAFCAECGELVAELTPCLDAGSDAAGLLEDVRAMNVRIVRRLEEEQRRVAVELARVGAARLQMRAVRFDEDDDDPDWDGVVDRET